MLISSHEAKRLCSRAGCLLPYRLALVQGGEGARLSVRYGYHIEQWLAVQGRKIEVINLAEDGKEDLVQDFVSIVTSFCARLYGQRRSKRKTEQMIAELQGHEEGHHPSQA